MGIRFMTDADIHLPLAVALGQLTAVSSHVELRLRSTVGALCTLPDTMGLAITAGASASSLMGMIAALTKDPALAFTAEEQATWTELLKQAGAFFEDRNRFVHSAITGTTLEQPTDPSFFLIRIATDRKGGNTSAAMRFTLEDIKRVTDRGRDVVGRLPAMPMRELDRSRLVREWMSLPQRDLPIRS